MLDLVARKIVATYPFTARCVAITPAGKRALATSAERESIRTAMLYAIRLPP